MNKAKLNNFNDIYNKTYNNTLKYVLLHCNNLDDVKDIVQDTYLDLYKFLSKKKLKSIENIDKYIIGISKNILKKYYYLKDKNCKVLPILNNDTEVVIDSEIDLELEFITKENVRIIWEYIKNKNTEIAKIFYAYYHLGMKINEIALEMQLNESTVKNYIYRTIKELKQIVKWDEKNDKK